MNSNILHAAVFSLSPEGFWGLPILGWGKSGKGKTAFIRDVARQCTDLPFKRLSPAEMGEGMFGVVPVPAGDGFLDYPAPAWSREFADGGLIFMDEISTAQPALQAPLLGFVQNRTLGSFTFPRRTRVIGAGNETAEAAGGWDLAAPLANRFGHFTFEGYNAEDWAAALLAGFGTNETARISAREEEARVLAAWPRAMALAAAQVSSFIRRNPGALYKQPALSSSDVSRAWPSNRSCHCAAFALASSIVHNLNEIDTDTFMEGFVGLPWVREFAAFRANLDLPDPSDLLDGKVRFEHNPDRLDRSMVTLGAVSALAVSEIQAKKLTPARGNMAWTIIGGVLRTAADCAVPGARAMIKAGIIAPAYKEASGPCERLWPILQASGMRA